MNIGKVIKELRQKKKMSQEELGEYLGVSTQAVSRWETSVSYPDITLLPLIANVFNVTTDYLLCFDKVTNEKIASDVEKNYYNEYMRIGNNVGGYNYINEMLEKYPSNEKIQLLYVNACFSVGNYDKELTSKGVSICKKIIETTTNNYIKNEAIDWLFKLYIKLDKKQEAKEVFYTFIKPNIKKDVYSDELLEGKELIEYLQNKTYNIVDDLWSIIMSIDNEAKYYSLEERINILEKYEKVLEILFEHKDYTLDAIWMLETIYYRIAWNYCKLENKEHALKNLEKACNYAILQDTRENNIKHKSLLFNMLSDKREDMTWSGSQEDYGNRCYECSKILNYKAFDCIKDEEEYLELVEKVNKYKIKYN